MTLPRVLVLDDLSGWSAEDRRLMCRNLAFASITDGDVVDGESKYLAEAVFHPAQTRQGNEIVNDTEAALRAVAEGWDGTPEHRWGLVLLDLQFDYGQVNEGPLDPDNNWPRRGDREFGLRILEAMARRWPDPENPIRTELPVVVLSTRPRAELEGILNNLGNLSYLEREREGQSVPNEDLRHQIADHLFHFALLEDGPLPRVDAEGRPTRLERPVHIVGKSLSLLRALRKARRAARADGPCLLLGPPGSGKELLARYRHDLSPRAAMPFEAVNCAALPETLIESELFGYAPNSGLANADRRGKPGRFELADGGSIFLDEIGDMSAPAQAKVLRVLQDGVVQRLSATTSKKIDVRVIAATNKNLQAAVSSGCFRDDLLGRLEGFVINIPSLKERTEDINLLFDFFLKRETEKLGGISKRRIDPAVYRTIQSRSWTNNIRDLENLAKQIASDRRYSEEITLTDVPPERTLPVGTDRNVEEGVTTVLPAARTSTVQLDDVRATLVEAKVPTLPRELDKSLPPLQAAFGGLVLRMLEAALEATRNRTGEGRDSVLGDLVPTKAMKLLLGERKMAATKAASEILRLSKLFPEIPPSNSDVGRVLAWAESLRRGGGRRDSKDSDEDE